MDASSTAEEQLIYVVPNLPDQYFAWKSGDPDTWSFTIDTLSDSKGWNGPNRGNFCNSYMVGVWQQNRLKYMDQQGNWKYTYGPHRFWVRRLYCNPNDPTGQYWVIADETGDSSPLDGWAGSN